MLLNLIATDDETVTYGHQGLELELQKTYGYRDKHGNHHFEFSPETEVTVHRFPGDRGYSLCAHNRESSVALDLDSYGGLTSNKALHIVEHRV